MNIIHHCLVTKHTNEDGVYIEEFRGVDAIDLLCEPYQALSLKCKDGEYGWTFAMKCYDNNTAIRKYRLEQRREIESEFATLYEKYKSNKKKLAEVEEAYKLRITEFEETEYDVVLFPFDEHGNAYSESHVRSIYNQVIELKKLYSK